MGGLLVFLETRKALADTLVLKKKIKKNAQELLCIYINKSVFLLGG